MDRQELIDYLVNDIAAISEHQAHEMDSYSLFVEALEYEGIQGYDDDIKEWIEPYYQNHFSESPEELNISVDWIKEKYHQLVKAGIITEEPKPKKPKDCDIHPESEPSPHYPDDIFNP